MSLDLIIPAYNEAHRIDATLRAYLEALAPDARILVALDRSSDDTAAIVRRYAEVDPRVELHEFPGLGKGGAIMEVFRRCTAEIVGFVDADGATPPPELLRLVDALPGADVVLASRRHPASVVPAARPLSRRLSSAVFAGFVQRLFGMPYLDTQCGAKVLRLAAVRQIVPLLSARDFLFDVDLLIVARALGFSVREVPTVWVDQEGSRLDTARDSIKMGVALLRLWLHHRTLPLGKIAEALQADTGRPAEKSGGRAA